MRTVRWALCAVLAIGCASTQKNKATETEPTLPPSTAGVGGSGEAAVQTPSGESVAPAAQVEQTRFVDDQNGFEIERPTGEWSFRSGEELSTETIAVPVVIANSQQGAQVVVQVAPAVATPAQFAERLTEGLTSRAGFETTEVRPIEVAEGAVGFDFKVGDQVNGRVAILDGREGRVYVLLATWPQNAPEGVEGEVDTILGSMKAMP